MQINYKMKDVHEIMYYQDHSQNDQTLEML